MGSRRLAVVAVGRKRVHQRRSPPYARRCYCSLEPPLPPTPPLRHGIITCVCFCFRSTHDSSRRRRPPQRAVAAATRPERRVEGTFRSSSSHRRRLTEAVAPPPRPTTAVVVPPRTRNSAPAIGRATVRTTRTPPISTTTTATDRSDGLASDRPCRCPPPSRTPQRETKRRTPSAADDAGTPCTPPRRPRTPATGSGTVSRPAWSRRKTRRPRPPPQRSSWGQYAVFRFFIFYLFTQVFRLECRTACNGLI